MEPRGAASRLELKGIGKRRCGAAVLERIELDVARGELVVIVGPSASGKTTILRIIAGLEEPTEGHVRIGGHDASPLPPRDRGVAMVFQGLALYPHLTVAGNLAFGIDVPRAERRRRVTEVADSLGIASLLDRLPHTLSGGEKGRVALGRALAAGRPILLLDEPLAGLDRALRSELRSVILRIHRQGASSTVLVTHDQTDAMALADRLLIIRAGRCEQVGPPGEVYASPRSTWVARFLGDPPMNLLAAIALPSPAPAPDRSGGQAGGLQLLAAGEARLPVPPGVRLEPGRAVTAGVRPEAFRLVDPERAWIRGAVCAVDLLGGEKVIHLSTSAGEVLARLPSGAAVARGDGVCLAGDDCSVRLFDGATGLALAGA